MKILRSMVWSVAFMVAGLSSVMASGFGDLVLAFPITEEMTGEEIDEAIMSQSIEQGINHVFFAPLYKQVEAITGESYRHMTIHHLCDARLGAQIADLDESMVVMMPCRVAVVESKDQPGKFTLYTTNPMVVLEDPGVSDEIKRLIFSFAPKLKALTENVAAGEF
jgi:hypothetical protein